MTSKEISVRVTQIVESADVSTGQAKLQGYELFDLVGLSGGGATNEVGVVVRVGREEVRTCFVTFSRQITNCKTCGSLTCHFAHRSLQFEVVNNHGQNRTVRPEELRGKRNTSSLRAAAMDFQGNHVRVGDSVNVIEGAHKNKSATIKHIHRAQLFLHSQMRTENAGIFIARARSCSLLAGTRGKTVETGLRAGAGKRPVQKEGGMMGKSVKITGGQWKGYLGMVSNETDDSVQVELHSRPKKVYVKKERVKVVGDKFGSHDDSGHAGRLQESMGAGSSTPFMGSATPMGGMTPMNVGGVTPGGGGMTPAGFNYNDDEEEVSVSRESQS